jgi:hypothetical protein
MYVIALKHGRDPPTTGLLKATTLAAPTIALTEVL